MPDERLMSLLGEYLSSWDKFGSVPSWRMYDLRGQLGLWYREQLKATREKASAGSVEGGSAA